MNVLSILTIAASIVFGILINLLPTTQDFTEKRKTTRIFFYVSAIFLPILGIFSSVNMENQISNLSSQLSQCQEIAQQYKEDVIDKVPSKTYQMLNQGDTLKEIHDKIEDRNPQRRATGLSGISKKK